MPRVSSFFGIVVSMNYNDHRPPHFHAKYGSDRACFSIDTLDCTEGRLPRRAQAMVVEYVNKKRSADHNVLDEASLSKPVEVGAVWTTQAPPGRKRSGAPEQASVLHAGHFMVSPGPMPGPNAVASTQHSLPAWLLALPLRIKQELP